MRLSEYICVCWVFNCSRPPPFFLLFVVFLNHVYFDFCCCFVSVLLKCLNSLALDCDIQLRRLCHFKSPQIFKKTHIKWNVDFYMSDAIDQIEDIKLGHQGWCQFFGNFYWKAIAIQYTECRTFSVKTLKFAKSLVCSNKREYSK